MVLQEVALLFFFSFSSVVIFISKPSLLSSIGLHGVSAPPCGPVFSDFLNIVYEFEFYFYFF